MARSLESLKTILQIDSTDTSQDTLLHSLVAQCELEFCSRTHQEEAEDGIVDAMVIERYNKLGNEGVTSGTYSGISENFESDYSEAVQKLIRSRARMVAI